jgi:xanthine/CO dehydrogenase XdhC/CoxF family maturation factor
VQESTLAEAERLVELWERAKNRGEQLYLATLVHVQGSSYRKPGARMLISSSGERAGTISGGCLEAEVARKIRWLTEDGARVEKYRSSFDDENAGVPYGLGCGGTLWILMETGTAVDQVMRALCLALRHRTPSVTISSIAENRPHTTSIISYTELQHGSETHTRLLREARQAFHQRRAIPRAHPTSSDAPEFVCIPVLPPPKLHLFGAGDDAQPIVRFAAELGWEIHVADGRANLLRTQRFPAAKTLVTLKYGPPDSHQRPMRVLAPNPLVQAGDRAVILTHSYEQDRALLQELLPHPLEYLGILGPLHRTTRIIDEIKDHLGLSREECFARLHAPVGLPLGAGDPTVIALAIVAEIQADSADLEGSDFMAATSAGRVQT